MIQKIFAFLHSIRKFYRRITGIRTRGARAIIFYNNKILLVQHRYNDLWVLPGGKVDGSHTPEETIVKELHEEVSIIVKEIAYKLGTYNNSSGGKNDEVHIFVIGGWNYDHEYKPSLLDRLEIRSQKWFGIEELPEQISDATLRRINEFMEGKKELFGDW